MSQPKPAPSAAAPAVPPGGVNRLTQSPTQEQPSVPKGLDDWIIQGVAAANRVVRPTEPGVVFRNQPMVGGVKGPGRQTKIHASIAPKETAEPTDSEKPSEGSTQKAPEDSQKAKDESKATGKGGNDRTRLWQPPAQTAPGKPFIPRRPPGESPAVKNSGTVSGWTWGQPQDVSKQ